MPPTKKVDFEKLAWAWVDTVAPEELQKEHLETAYRIGLKQCKNCKRNCSNNPTCVTGLGEEKYIKSCPAEVASLESSLSELRDPTQYVGLKNLGATCYVNSLIQVWFHNEDMRRIIYKWNITEDPEEREGLSHSQSTGQPYLPVTVVGQLQYIFAMLQFGNREVLDPTNLAIALSLDTRTQQDAQEFSKLLLCHIEGKLQQNMSLKAKLQRLTQGKYSYVNWCSTCESEYLTSTTFYELDLQLAPTLPEAIDKYLTEEELVGPNQYHCATCNEKMDARRFIRLDSLPETLNIQLLRFVFHRDSGQKKKLNSFIQFPKELDMSEHLRCPPLTHLYSLVAVLSHKGPSAHSGHYIANICNSSGEWYQFSDDKVEKMEDKRIENGLTDTTTKVSRRKVPKGYLSSNTAYMLVYKRLSPSSKQVSAGRRGRPKRIERIAGSDLTSETQTSDDAKRKTCSDVSASVTSGATSTTSNNSSRSSSCSGKRTRLDAQDDVTAMIVDENETPRLSPEQKNIINGIVGYHPPTSPQQDTVVPKIEKPPEETSAATKNVKIEDGLLNGDAHTNMSCDERDSNEDMELEKSKLSGTPRKLVKEENVKHELSILAAQQEKDTVVPKIEESLSPEQKNIINGIVGYHPPTSPQQDTVVPKIEEPPEETSAATKNVKIEYGLLNGDAHRNMSCGERDFYEDMEFEKWELSGTLRELVREENVKHELSILAVQQEKQKEIEDRNAKRQQVIDFYGIVGNAGSDWSGGYQWIPTDWLVKWLNDPANTEVAPIDNSTLMCTHYHLDPSKVNRAKCVPPAAAELLFKTYRGGPRLDQNSLCDACVKRRCKMFRFKSGLERDYKEVTEIMRTFKQPSKTSYIVGADSLKSWHRLAMEKFIEGMEHEMDDPSNNDSASDEPKSSSGKETSESKCADESEENEAVMNFNEDLLCEHNALKTRVASRKIVPSDAWTILEKYFPDAKKYPMNTPPCDVCEAVMASARRTKEDDKIKAKIQKDELSNLYYARNRNEIMKCNEPEKTFYIVEKGFLDCWRSFIRFAQNALKPPPSEIQNAHLLCEAHKGFLYSPTTMSESYTIVSEVEWLKLLQFYNVDHTITIRRKIRNTGVADTEFVTNPDRCAVCMLSRVEQERLERLTYDKASIYVKFIDEVDDVNSENDSEISAKRPKMGTKRSPRTCRKVKGSHELKVSSAITLKELKVMIMPFCGAGPYDQHLMLGEHELTDHSQSLGALGIFPGALLTLKVNTPTESEADDEADVIILDATASPEKGFKGTELVPSGSG